MSAGLHALTRSFGLPVPHIPRLRFGPHDRITIGRLHYTNAQPVEGGHVLNRVDLPGMFENFSHDEIYHLSNQRDWRLDPGYFSPESARTRSKVGTARIDELLAKERPDVVWKWEWCSRFTKLYGAGERFRTEAGMEAAIKGIMEGMIRLDVAMTPEKPKRKAKGAKPRKVSAGTKIKMELREPPCERTLWRWLAKLEELGNVPSSLRDSRYKSGCRTPQITGEAHLLLVEYANRYATEEKPPFANLHREMKAEIKLLNEGRPLDKRISCPSVAALRAQVASLGKFFVCAGRHGPDYAKRKFAIITSGVVVTRPYERIEIDSWKVDLQTILTRVGLWERLDGKARSAMKRMHFCAAIDPASKIIVGANLSESADTAAAMAVLRMAVTNKRAFAEAAGATLPWDQHGTFEALNADGGSQFNNPEFIGAVAALGCSPDFPSGGVPGLRGSMESFFRTVGHQLVGRLPGKTFHSVAARGDYDPMAHAVIDASELARLLTRWIVDAYHGSPHDGLAGETPHDAWNRLTKLYGIGKGPDRHKIRSIFGIPLTRRLGNGGIRALNLRYWCEPLEKHFLDRGNVDLEIKLDAEDLGEIAVCIDGVWHLAWCVREGFEDVTLETWIRAGRDLQRTHAIGAAATELAVAAAIRDAGVLARDAKARAGISSTYPTAADIDRAEREIMQGWTMPDTSPSGTVEDATDPLDRGIPVTGRDDAQPARPIAGADDYDIEG